MDTGREDVPPQAVLLVFSAEYQGLLTILPKPPPEEAHPLSRLLFVSVTKQAQYGLLY